MKSSLLNLISLSSPFTFLPLLRLSHQTRREGGCHAQVHLKTSATSKNLPARVPIVNANFRVAGTS